MPEYGQVLDNLQRKNMKYLISIDLKNAFHHLRLHEATKVGFEYRKQTYRFTRLPKGDRFSPWILTKVLECTIQHVQSKFPDLLLYSWMHDIMVASTAPFNAQEVTREIARHGWQVNFKKIPLNTSHNTPMGRGHLGYHVIHRTYIGRILRKDPRNDQATHKIQ
jgi:hypothetical protein